MGFDDDIRRHLQDTGEQVELSGDPLAEGFSRLEE